MKERIKKLPLRSKISLVILAVLFCITILGGILLPLMEKEEELSVEESRKILKNSVWTRDTKNGEEALMFTEFGGLLIGTLQDSNGKLSQDTQWLSYEINDKDILTIRNGSAGSSSNGTNQKRYEGEHSLKFKDNYIIFDDMQYRRLSDDEFTMWLNYYNDYHYWDSWSEEEVKEEDANRQNGSR